MVAVESQIVESQINEAGLYAVVETSGRQYVVRPDSVIDLNHLGLAVGDVFETDKVLLISPASGSLKLGLPYVAGAKVRGVVLKHLRGPKVLVFKQKRRKNYSRTRGHRQEITRVRIDAIEGI